MSCELNTIAQVREWLNDPKNQFNSDLFVVRWDGATPTIAVRRLKELNDVFDPGLAQVILIEHKRRKNRPEEIAPDAFGPKNDVGSQ